MAHSEVPQQLLERISLHVRALRQMASAGDGMEDVLGVLKRTEETLRLIVDGDYED